jgi:hypothetical protein
MLNFLIYENKEIIYFNCDIIYRRTNLMVDDNSSSGNDLDVVLREGRGWGWTFGQFHQHFYAHLRQ